MADRSEFDDFVARRSQALLRTAYLLTGDHELAEDLLQTALAKSWFAWGRIFGPPEPYVRRVIATTYATWWRRKWTAEHPSDDLPDVAADDHAATALRRQLLDALALLPLLALPLYPSGLVVLETSREVRTSEVGLGQAAGSWCSRDSVVCWAAPEPRSGTSGASP